MIFLLVRLMLALLTVAFVAFVGIVLYKGLNQFFVEWIKGCNKKKVILSKTKQIKTNNKNK